MADLPLLAEQLLGRPQLCTPRYAEIVVSVLAKRLHVQPIMSAPDVQAVVKRPARFEQMASGVLVLPIVGGLIHRGSNVAASSGSAAYTAIQNRLIDAVNSDEVSGILLDIDSPGGQAVGCFELADAIVALGKRKPIWAIANGLAASAAYAIGASAKRLMVTPSGTVGSIGVVWMHTDLSKALDQAGIAITYVYAGKHKIDGNPYQPLPPDVKESIQAEIDAKYEQFVSVVAARRPMTPQQIRKTQADVFSAEEAVKLGLADDVATFDATLTAFQRELRPKLTVVSVSPTGAAAVSQTENAPAAPATTRIEGLEQALVRAREDGMAAARAEAGEKIIDAYNRGRKDAAAILGSEAAQGRMAQAIAFAGSPKWEVEEALAMLGAMPADTGSSFQKKLAANDPKVPGTSASSETGQSDPVRDYQAGVSAMIAKRLGHAK